MTERNEVRGSSDSLITESWPANWVELYNLLLEGHEDVFNMWEATPKEKSVREGHRTSIANLVETTTILRTS
jgi:hypothetical protein